VTDPPVLPSEDDPQGVEVAAGFALSMEDSNPDVEDLPARVDNNDLDLLDDVYLVLRDNSETGHLTHIKVQVNRGVVNLLGTVATEDDIWRVHEVVKSLDGVVAITNNLQVEE
jgi:osmotically-inducible protein OsmY